ncbi:hypothetical protein MTR_4g054990 [Medicago truncatula]|uniref:Reverse transcriptase zinc-binding domain-containing protein n=1 Tax=Medicago truncatula TaxID=3880 RepID=G7JKW5_MEDTR|nr:hypothetical protein MTR_4g054990 [Medicago truncatula]
MLTSHEQPHVNQNMELIWHKQTVALHLWTVEARFCVTGCGHVEDVNHMFLSCPFFGALWPMVRAWLDAEGVDSHAISDHFVQFIEYVGGLKFRRSLFHLIWLQCVWVLLKERNDRLFRNCQSSIPLLLDKVKSHTLWWLKDLDLFVIVMARLVLQQLRCSY